MQSQRYGSSVSDIYATDEVELLLDEIRELEPTNLCPEDIQDFEIAGSQTGAGGRSPVGTEHSWDSHAHYRRPPPPPPAAIAPIYCHLRSFLSITGSLRLVLVLLSVWCCGTIWSVVGLRLWLVPLAGRLRLLLLAALSSLLLHGLLLFLHVTKLTQLFHMDWNKLTVWLCVWSGMAYLCGGSLVLHAVLAAPEYRWAPAYVFTLLTIAASVGLLSAGVSGALAAGAWRACAGPGMRASGAGGARSRTASSVSVRAAYRPLPRAGPSRLPDPPL